MKFANQQDIIIAMSLDGIRSVHDAHRLLPDGKGTFDLLLSRLKLLLEAKPYASVIMVVNPDTVASMTDSVTFLLDQGVRYLIVALNYAGPWDDESLKILEQQYHKLAKLYIKWTQKGKKFYLSPFEVKIASHINYHKADTLRCDCGTRQLSVDPNGYLYPCVQFTAAGPQSPWCIGSVSNGIDSTALQRICSYKKKINHTCKNCAIEKRCLHTCACLNWQTTGSLTKISPVLCQHERILTPIADQVGETLYAQRNKQFIQKHYNDAYPLLSLLEDHLSGA
ncbi:radical SAM protein [Planctomycetota bacterium]